MNLFIQIQSMAKNSLCQHEKYISGVICFQTSDLTRYCQTYARGAGCQTCIRLNSLQEQGARRASDLTHYERRCQTCEARRLRSK
ncbi:MAG: hypothetical protein LBK25_07785 [Treponema sp.]|nr:hypothetical protein [Treponema sp.]